jgi:positive regulator of sigma E activity
MLCNFFGFPGQYFELHEEDEHGSIHKSNLIYFIGIINLFIVFTLLDALGLISFVSIISFLYFVG